MSELTSKQVDELRALQHMADKGMAAWTNADFQDLLAAYDKSAEIRAQQSDQISKLGAKIERLRQIMWAIIWDNKGFTQEDIEWAGQYELDMANARIAELEMLLNAAEAEGK